MLLGVLLELLVDLLDLVALLVGCLLQLLELVDGRGQLLDLAAPGVGGARELGGQRLGGRR
eukprot:4724013-Pyramimonas_sp.AAC.1